MNCFVSMHEDKLYRKDKKESNAQRQRKTQKY